MRSRVARGALVFVAAAACAVGCARDDSGADGAKSSEMPGFCERDRADQVRDLFCQTPPATIGNLLDLQAQLGFDPSQLSGGTSAPEDASVKDFRVIALGHSTSLAGHVVSPINPRVFLLRNDLVMAFQRGTQQVELAARDHVHPRFNFYLIRFTQACNGTAEGCSAGDLYTPRIEQNWASVSILDDEDLKNTAEDCRQCHARGRDEPQLLMRELREPWTHFFYPLSGMVPRVPGVSGVELTKDFIRAKGDEPYANVPGEKMQNSAPILLQTLVGSDQPLLFDSQKILDERWPDGGEGDPLPSPTWEEAYEGFKRGEQLAFPYFDTRATDPKKQAQLSEAYARYRAGELEAAELPDLSDIFPDDPLARAHMGLQCEPDASPVDALIQTCGSCHNDVLDQSISRARFNIDLARLDREEIDLAIERIELPPDAPGAMPPAGARQLDPDSRARLLAYLRDYDVNLEADPALRRAAELGMAGVVSEQEGETDD